MSNVLAFLKARLAERSTQVQILTAAICAAVAAGLVSVAQVTSWTTGIMSLLAVAAPIVGMLVPDGTSATSSAGAADTLIEMATSTVEHRVTGSDAVATDIATLVDGLAPIANAATTIVTKATTATVVAPAAVVAAQSAAAPSK